MARSKKVKPMQKVREKNTGVDLRVQSHKKCHRVKFVFDVLIFHWFEIKLVSSFPHTYDTSHILD